MAVEKGVSGEEALEEPTMSRPRVQIFHDDMAEWLPDRADIDSESLLSWQFVRHEHPEDIKRIARVVREHGYRCTYVDATTIWAEHSGEVYSCWLGLPEDDEVLWSALSQWIVGTQEQPGR